MTVAAERRDRHAGIDDVLAGRSSWAVIQGEALATLRAMPDASVDALVTDPPAGIEFMGKEWDSFKTGRLEKYNVQPGGKVGAAAVAGSDFGARMGALPPLKQKANRRCVMCNRYQWGHKTGDRGGGGKGCECPSPEWAADHSTRDTFIAAMTPIFAECLRVLRPGAHGLVWSIPRTSHWTATALEDAGFEVRDRVTHLFGQGFPKSKNLDGDWQGWGTALKPAAEDWWLVRKPLDRPNVAANVLAHGTGAINVDGCRIEGAMTGSWGGRQVSSIGYGGTKATDYRTEQNPAGRWPAHVVLSHHPGCNGVCAPGCPVAEIDRQSGPSTSRKGTPRGSATAGDGWGMTRTGAEYDDTGGASRFFYTSKASRSERNAGLGNLPEKPLLWSAGTQNPGSFQSEGTHKAAQNHHPTGQVARVDALAVSAHHPARWRRAGLFHWLGLDRRGSSARGLPLRRYRER